MLFHHLNPYTCIAEIKSHSHVHNRVKSALKLEQKKKKRRRNSDLTEKSDDTYRSQTCLHTNPERSSVRCRTRVTAFTNPRNLSSGFISHVITHDYLIPLTAGPLVLCSLCVLQLGSPSGVHTGGAFVPSEKFLIPFFSEFPELSLSEIQSFVSPIISTQ